MDLEQIKEYNFDDDMLPPGRVIKLVRSHDNYMDEQQPDMAMAKSSYTTNFWRHIDGMEEVSHELSRLDQVEVNRIKPALSGYLASLYPRRIETVIADSPYTVGDSQKAEMVINDWLNQPVMRDRIMSASRQALLYGGAGAKIGYDPSSEGLSRVWMRVFPFWEMLLDRDVHDWEDARFIGHISYKPKNELMDQYDISETDLGGVHREDFLGGYMDGDDESDQSQDEFVRVLEFCNLIDEYRDTDGTVYKGRLEIYILDGREKPVYIGPMPLVNARNQPMSHVVPLIFEHEPEYPYRGLAYAKQLMPQQRELNAMRSFQASASRRDSRIYLARKGALDADSYSDLRNGEDGLIIEVDEQYAGNLGNVIVPIQHGPVSANILNTMQMAESDLDRNMTISPAALGVVTKATAAEITAVEGHTESEFGRHAEMRDLWLLRLVRLCLAAHVASMYDPGDSEGGEEEAPSDEEFKPHMMYDPETGESEKAEKVEDHERLKSEGWVHEKPKEEEEPKEEEDEDEVPEERKEEELNRSEMVLRLRAPDGEEFEVRAEDLDSDFDIGFTESGRTPMADAEMRNNLVQLSGQLMQLFQASQEQGPIGMYSEELLKAIHERFNLPANLHPDYIANRMAQEPPPPGMPPEAPPPEAPPEPPPETPEPETPSLEEIVARIEQMPPAEALAALEELLVDAPPEAQQMIQQAKGLPPEQQAEGVAIILDMLKGQ